MNARQAPNINYAWTSLMIDELIRNGIDYFCLSPGSRSSPLANAVANNKKASSFVHFDERGAAFHALGHCSATKKPVVVISTSGTAGANFLPAVIEASKKKLPLIILTADRPPELRKTGADQTIDQVGIFGEYVRWQFDMPCPTTEINPEMVLTTVDQAVHRSKGSPQGPVHINCMFREPLAPVKGQKIPAEYFKNIKFWESSTLPYTRYSKPMPALDLDTKKEIKRVASEIRKGLIVVGKLASSREINLALELGQKCGWPIFPDITSGLRLGSKHPNVISYFDQLLLSRRFQQAYVPDGIIHLGGRITSKRWHQYLQELTPRQYVMVNSHPLRNDPLHNVTLRAEMPVNLFCEAFLIGRKAQRVLPAVRKLKSANELLSKELDLILNPLKQLNEIAVARIVSRTIPSEHGIFLASSMPIRDIDMYAVNDGESVPVGSNRGASGIDGTIASAIGFAQGTKRPTTLLIGDIAFLHDLNSLAMLQSTKMPLIVVVLNNNGGGIFSFLPIANFNNTFEKFHGTPHNLKFQDAAKMFGLQYAHPRTVAEFTSEYKKALKDKVSSVIEINSNRTDNYELHCRIQKKLAAVIDKYFKK